MRIAVLHPERTEPDGTVVPASTSAFRLGRIEDYVDPVTSKVTSATDLAAALLSQAREEFPDCEVRVERLVDNGDETSSWMSEDEVPEGATSPQGTLIQAPDITAEQSQEAS